jgi:S-ribosylhomocysteine lyase LuxS involved in autoinducer biosynthesis
MIERQEKQIYPPDIRLVYFNKNLRRKKTVRGMMSKKVKTVKESTLIATIDIGMTSNTGFYTTIYGRDIIPFRFNNTREGFNKF